jgi:hypothetical protein
MRMLTRLLCTLVLSFSLAAAVRAQIIEVQHFALEPSSGGYALNADIECDLTARLEEALNNGVALFFLLEFELTRPRWYWFDEKVANERLELRLSFNSLLRQYQVSTGSLHLNFSRLADAMGVLTRVRRWQVLDRDVVQPDTAYVAAVRMRLDTTQLPKPFQLSAFTDREWTLASAWKTMAFAATQAEHSRK